MDQEFRYGPKVKKAVLPSKKFHTIQQRHSKLKKSCLLVQKTGSRKSRRHSQHRHRLEIAASQTLVQVHEELLGKPRLRLEGSLDDNHGILKSSKKRRAGSSHFVSLDLCHPDELMSEVDTPSTSIPSFCSRPDTLYVSPPASSICVEKQQFELFTTEDSVANRMLTMKTQAFGESVSLYSTSATRICDDQHHSRIMFLALESSPEVNKNLTGRKRAKFLLENTVCFSPVMQSEGYARNEALNSMSGPGVSNGSASLMLSCRGSPCCCDIYDAALSPSVETAILSPNVMFQQLLEGQFLGFMPLIEAALSDFKKFHVDGPERDCDMLSNLQVKELELPRLWGYLNKSYITGIFEPHRYLVVLWQIQAIHSTSRKVDIKHAQSIHISTAKSGSVLGL